MSQSINQGKQTFDARCHVLTVSKDEYSVKGWRRQEQLRVLRSTHDVVGEEPGDIPRKVLLRNVHQNHQMVKSDLVGNDVVMKAHKLT